MDAGETACPIVRSRSGLAAAVLAAVSAEELGSCDSSSALRPSCCRHSDGDRRLARARLRLSVAALRTGTKRALCVLSMILDTQYINFVDCCVGLQILQTPRGLLGFFGFKLPFVNITYFLYGNTPYQNFDLKQS